MSIVPGTFEPSQASATRQADEAAMRIALDPARNAWLVGEVPVGAVILFKALPLSSYLYLYYWLLFEFETADAEAYPEEIAAVIFANNEAA